MDNYKRLRANCHNKKLDALGHYYIYSKRVQSITKWLYWSKIIGVLVPVSVGGSVGLYYTHKEALATKEDIANVYTEIAKAKTEMIRWYVALFVMLMLMIAGLYVKK